MILSAFILAAATTPDAAYLALEKRYVREFLRRHPVVSTYLGGSGLDPELSVVDGKLRDWSPGAQESEARTYRDLRDQMMALDGAALSPEHRIDREVAAHQIAFMVRQTEKRRYWQRSLDTYVAEPFRGVEWSLQGMTEAGEGRYGTEAEWRRVAARVAAIPAYLKQARANLAAGQAAGNAPDGRMIERDGLASSQESIPYFEKDLPETAAARTKGQPFSASIVAELRAKGALAGTAFKDFRRFLEDTLAKLPKQDRFAMGGFDYDWALQNNLAIPKTATQLFDESLAPVLETRSQLMATARAIAEKRGRKDLKFDDANAEASTRAIMDLLSEEFPKTDAEMIEAYRKLSQRLVEYGRTSGLFDVPADYRLDVTLTPAVLETAVDSASYYPAPIFKASGVGQFYVPVLHNDVERLKQHNRSAMAYLAAHEGFPGHDWHYKVMTEHRAQIGPVRWLTPGEVEGSASMWQDSVAAEGWGLYAEQLMGEPAPSAPQGFYAPEEKLYQLRGQLWRDLRVRVDTGLHTGRMKYDEAVDLVSVGQDFLPGSCQAAELTPVKKASCTSGERAIYRYSKWPTQAITYRLGKQQILALRARADALTPPADRKRFHMLYMQQGTIPPPYFEDALLDALKK